MRRRGLHHLALAFGLISFLPIAAAMVARPADAASSSPAQQKPGVSPTKSARGRTTTDLSALRLTRNIMTVRLEKGFFQVMEMLDFHNAGDATIVSKNGAPTLRFSLPRSSNVRNPRAALGAAPAGLDPKRIRVLGDQLITTEPIPPGRKFIVMTYRYADEYGGIRVRKPILYTTGSFAVLPEKDRVQMAVPGFSPQPEVNFQNRRFARFVGAARAGSFVTLDMKAPDSMGSLEVFYFVLAGVVVVGGVLGVWIRRRRAGSLSLQVEREGCLRAIAALDDRLASGEISSEAHRRERAPMFTRLRELSS